jgi:hypothetical protein
MRVTKRRLLGLVLAAGMAVPTAAAELFYMDHDTLTAKYVGAVGPLVLSGDIESGDYERLLTKIAQDPGRYLQQNRLILASERGDVTEALRIAQLVQTLGTTVVVDPQAGRCVGACFLIYAAAAERTTDGPGLLGVRDLPATGVYWLTGQDEHALGRRSPEFSRYLQKKCSWDDTVEREVFAGRRPFSDMTALLACRQRVTQGDARRALTAALAARSAGR